LYYSLNIVCVNRIERDEMGGAAEHMGETRNANLKERHRWRYIGVYTRIVLKCALKELGVVSYY